MTRRPLALSQAEIARTLRAMAQAGFKGVLEIRPDGTQVVVPAELAPETPAPRPAPAAVDGYEFIQL